MLETYAHDSTSYCYFGPSLPLELNKNTLRPSAQQPWTTHSCLAISESLFQRWWFPNDHAPSRRWSVHPKCTSQRWAGWGPALVPAWKVCPQLPDLLHSCPLALQQEVVHGTSWRAVGARDCASGGGDFQEQDDFPAMRTTTTMRTIHPVYISWLLRAAKHRSNPWVEKGLDCLVPTKIPLCTAVLKHAAEQKHSRGAVASQIVPVAAQFEEKWRKMKEQTRQSYERCLSTLTY